jgi:hypothetical protein
MATDKVIQHDWQITLPKEMLAHVRTDVTRTTNNQDIFHAEKNPPGMNGLIRASKSLTVGRHA